MPLGSVSPFRPTGSIGLSVGVVSTNVALAGGGDTIVVTNPSANLAFIRFGADATVIATTSDMPVLPNSNVILSVNSLIKFAAALTSSGTGSILFSRGDGSTV
jgi:hypothetical protein